MSYFLGSVSNSEINYPVKKLPPELLDTFKVRLEGEHACLSVGNEPALAGQELR